MTVLSALQTALNCGPIAYVSHDTDGRVTVAVDGLDDVRRACAEAIVREGATDPLAAACRWECRRRILARYSETDQVNAQRRATVLLRRFAAGTATAEELAEGDTLERASDWIDAMTAHWRTLAAAGRSPFANDAGWPEHP